MLLMKYINKYNTINSISDIQQTIVFSASYGHFPTVRNSVVQYNSIITNIGSAYSRTDCTFTAPTDGQYVFSWSTSQYDHRYTYTSIVKNGLAILYEAVGHISSDAMDSTSQTVVMHLSRGDRVWIRDDHGGANTYYEGHYVGVFTGFKL